MDVKMMMILMETTQIKHVPIHLKKLLLGEPVLVANSEIL